MGLAVRTPVTPWDRMANESESDYAFFMEYRKLDPRVRSVQRLIAEERTRRSADPDALPVGTLSLEQLDDLCRGFDWPRRAAMFDEFMRYEADAAMLSAARNAATINATALMDASEFNQEFFAVLKLRALEQGMLRKADFASLLKAMPHVVRSAEVAMKNLRLFGGQSTENFAIRGQMVIAGDAAIDLANVDHKDLRSTRELLQKVLNMSPADVQRALAKSEDVVEGSFSEVPDERA